MSQLTPVSKTIAAYDGAGLSPRLPPTPIHKIGLNDTNVAEYVISQTKAIEMLLNEKDAMALAAQRMTSQYQELQLQLKQAYEQIAHHKRVSASAFSELESERQKFVALQKQMDKLRQRDLRCTPRTSQPTACSSECAKVHKELGDLRICFRNERARHVRQLLKLTGGIEQGHNHIRRLEAENAELRRARPQQPCRSHRVPLQPRASNKNQPVRTALTPHLKLIQSSSGSLSGSSVTEMTRKPPAIGNIHLLADEPTPRPHDIPKPENASQSGRVSQQPTQTKSNNSPAHYVECKPAALWPPSTTPEKQTEYMLETARRAWASTPQTLDPGQSLTSQEVLDVVTPTQRNYLRALTMLHKMLKRTTPTVTASVTRKKALSSKSLLVRAVSNRAKLAQPTRVTDGPMGVLTS